MPCLNSCHASGAPDLPKNQVPPARGHPALENPETPQGTPPLLPPVLHQDSIEGLLPCSSREESLRVADGTRFVEKPSCLLQVGRTASDYSGGGMGQRPPGAAAEKYLGEA